MLIPQPKTTAEQQFQRGWNYFQADTDICERNKALLAQFLHDARIGKVNRGKQRSKVNPKRLLGYVNQLSHLMRYCKKPVDTLELSDMEDFVFALENGVIKARQPRLDGRKRTTTNTPISPRYAVDIKVTIRKFYQWQHNTKHYPALVDWFDTYAEIKEVKALTPAEVERMIDLASNVFQKALIQTFFDGGFRISELSNVRLEDIRHHNDDPTNPKQRSFLMRIRVSKTTPRTIELPMPATTKWITLWLEYHPAMPEIRSDGSLYAKDPKALLFPYSQTHLRHTINRVGRNALHKRVYPHLLRHTSATYWANFLRQYKMGKRFGWTVGSDMPQRYIDSTGIQDNDIGHNYREYEASRQQQRSTFRDFVQAQRPDLEPKTLHRSPLLSIRPSQH